MSQLSEILGVLTEQERMYVEAFLGGASKVASATAAGYSNPKNAATTTWNKPHVQEAVRNAKEIFANEVDFARRKAHDMLMEAHRGAADTIEQVTAIRELIKLHGVAAVEKKQLNVVHGGNVSLSGMTDKELVKLAGYDIALDAEYHEVNKEPECLPAPNAE